MTHHWRSWDGEAEELVLVSREALEWKRERAVKVQLMTQDTFVFGGLVSCLHSWRVLLAEAVPLSFSLWQFIVVCMLSPEPHLCSEVGAAIYIRPAEDISSHFLKCSRNPLNGGCICPSMAMYCISLLSGRLRKFLDSLPPVSCPHPSISDPSLYTHPMAAVHGPSRAIYLTTPLVINLPVMSW